MVCKYSHKLNLEKLAEDCSIKSDDAGFVISKIEELSKLYSSEDLVHIYNYFLSQSQNPEVLLYLIRCCDRYRNISSLEYLVDLLLLHNENSIDESLKEKFLNVRVMAIKAIGNLKNNNAVPTLLYCLNNKNENYRIRLACADALGKIGDRFAVSPLIDVVQDEDEKSVYLKESATQALGLLGDKRALDPLLSILETKQGIADKFSFLKERVLEALNRIGKNDEERVFKALKNSLSDESTQVRINAIEAIMNSDHPLAFDVIKKCLLNDEDEEVKKNALIALYNLSDRSILDEVISSSDFSDQLKISAVEIIEEYEEN